MSSDLTSFNMLDHVALVQRAEKWLRGTRKQSFIITQASLATEEQPDAIGWNGKGISILVECKISRSDFHRDRNKPFRQHPSLGMGNERYYLTPPGLLKDDDLPEGWGWLEAQTNVIRVCRMSGIFHQKAFFEELKCVLAAHRRRELEAME